MLTPSSRASGRISMKAVPMPAVTETASGRSRADASTCGMPRLMPTFAPVAVSMMLFGPA